MIVNTRTKATSSKNCLNIINVQSSKFIRHNLFLVISSIFLSGCLVNPEPLRPDERTEGVNRAIERLENTPMPSKPISLSEAIARSIRYNLETKAQAYQAVIENTQIDISNLAMLPDILTSSGYRFRDPQYESFAPNENGQPDRAGNPTVGETRQRRLQDLTFNWNVLDLGLSYYRAQQQADRAIIAIEAERRTRQQIVQDTIAAWYKAKTEHRIKKELEPLLLRVRHVLNLSQQAEIARIQEPLEALSYQREILETVQNLDYWKKDLAGSEYNLASMLGLKSRDDVPLGESDIDVNSTHIQRATLQNEALNLRPDIQSVLYEARMSKRDAIIAFIELAPIPTFTLGNNYDSNQFLFYNEWFSLGGQIGLNLVKLSRIPTVHTLTQEKIDLAKQKVVAVVSAALVQVDIALTQLKQWEDIASTAKANQIVSDKIVHQVKSAQLANQAGELLVVKEELRKFVAEVRYDIARNEEKAAAARLMASTGIDFASADGTSIEESARRIRTAVSNFNSGNNMNNDINYDDHASIKTQINTPLNGYKSSHHLPSKTKHKERLRGEM